MLICVAFKFQSLLPFCIVSWQFSLLCTIKSSFKCCLNFVWFGLGWWNRTIFWAENRYECGETQYLLFTNVRFCCVEKQKMRKKNPVKPHSAKRAQKKAKRKDKEILSFTQHLMCVNINAYIFSGIWQPFTPILLLTHFLTIWIVFFAFQKLQWCC